MIWLLNNGHGGLINGEYQTAGKRSPVYSGRVLYEGEFNRSIVNRLIERLTEHKIPYVNITPEYEDISLTERVLRANEYPKNSVYLSIHANAGGGSGFEVYTSKGETKADRHATYFISSLEKSFPNISMRYDNTDGDKDKEANFYELKHTKMPAVLVESLFMDNPMDCQLLFSENFRNDFANAILDAILMIEYQ